MGTKAWSDAREGLPVYVREELGPVEGMDSHTGLRQALWLPSSRARLVSE